MNKYSEELLKPTLLQANYVHDVPANEDNLFRGALALSKPCHISMLFERTFNIYSKLWLA